MIQEQPGSGPPREPQRTPAASAPRDTSGAPPVCATCRAVAGGVMPPTWSLSTEGGQRVWTCERCAREHLRSIEAKLDGAWW